MTQMRTCEVDDFLIWYKIKIIYLTFNTDWYIMEYK